METLDRLRCWKGGGWFVQNAKKWTCRYEYKYLRGDRKLTNFWCVSSVKTLQSQPGLSGASTCRERRRQIGTIWTINLVVLFVRTTGTYRFGNLLGRKLLIMPKQVWAVEWRILGTTVMAVRLQNEIQFDKLGLPYERNRKYKHGPPLQRSIPKQMTTTSCHHLWSRVGRRNHSKLMQWISIHCDSIEPRKIST